MVPYCCTQERPSLSCSPGPRAVDIKGGRGAPEEPAAPEDPDAPCFKTKNKITVYPLSRKDAQLLQSVPADYWLSAMTGPQVGDALVSGGSVQRAQSTTGLFNGSSWPPMYCKRVGELFLSSWCVCRALKSHAFGVRHTQFNPSTGSHATLRISHAEKLPG